MKFAVTRTSKYSSDPTPPCEGAVREPIVRRSTYRPEPVTEYAWTITFPDLAALVAFCEREGECVITGPSDWDGGLPSIEIYDSWRE